MARKIYIGSSGSSRNVSDIYIGISGRSRKVTKGYIGINDIAKKFYGLQYMWKRYTIETVNTYEETSKRYANFRYITAAASQSGKLPTRCEFDTSTGKFILSDLDIVEIRDDGMTSEYYTTEVNIEYYDNTGYLVGFTAIKEGAYDGPIYNIEAHRYVWPSMNTESNVDIYTSSIASSMQSAGTYLADIYSENRNAYPNNGISGNYWYIYQGTYN